MQFLVYISDYMIPFVILYIVGYGILCKVDVFDCFIKGAKDGFKTVFGIMPTLIGLMVAIGILRASGAFSLLESLLTPFAKAVHFPATLVPLVLIKMFSSSAASSLLIDIYRTYGPDSFLGTLSSVLMSCSETIFYTMSVYFMTAKVTKTRYTLAGAIISTLAGIFMSVLLVEML